MSLDDQQEQTAGPPIAAGRPARRPLGFLAADLPVSGFGPGWRDLPVSGLALDSRRVQPGDLFCALQGQRGHGLAHWGEAVARGATGLLTDAGQIPPAGAVGLLAAHPRRVLALLAARLYGHPADRLALLGVTGTNGKTTTVHMLHQVLTGAGVATAAWSTAWVEAPAGFRPQMTTPDAPDLHAFLARAVAAGRATAVLEVSSHAVVLERLAGLRFRVGVVTNVTPDHLDFHGSFAAYAAAKERFIRELPRESFAVLNRSDPVAAGFAPRAGAQVVAYGWGPHATWGGDEVATGPDATTFRLWYEGRPRGRVRLPVPGRHNVLNALAAMAAAAAHGVAWDRAAGVLEHFEPPVRRLEPCVVGPYTIINDVAMNRASYDAVLGAMRDLGRPLVVVNAVRGNRGPAVNREIAETLARWDRELHFGPVISTTSDGEVGRLAVDYLVRPEELDAFVEAARAAGLAVSSHRRLDAALAEAASRCVPGGILLLLGTFGMDAGPEMAARLLARRAGVIFAGLPRRDRRGDQEVPR
jgi:UDP-N-acetylmuramoyl-L-alanyl-D-glutamate--2,6-diaminopimelate ligase